MFLNSTCNYYLLTDNDWFSFFFFSLSRNKLLIAQTVKSQSFQSAFRNVPVKYDSGFMCSLFMCALIFSCAYCISLNFHSKNKPNPTFSVHLFSVKLPALFQHSEAADIRITSPRMKKQNYDENVNCCL